MQQLLDYAEVKQKYSELSKGLQRAVYASKSTNEEKLKILTVIEFSKFFDKFGINLGEFATFEDTSTAGTRLKGKTDVLTGSLVMEFKTYKLLNTPSELRKACKQIIEQYLNPLDEKLSPFFTGIIFDGENVVFVNYDSNINQWIPTKKRLNSFVIHDWVLLIIKTLKKPISSKELTKSFSTNTKLAGTTISNLYRQLNNSLESNERVKMLFDEWKKSFSYIYGGILNEDKIREDFETVAKIIDTINLNAIEVDKFLFCFYTYYALIVKLYASEIASVYLPISPDSPINALLRTKELKEALRYIESGTFYKDYADIDNYIEGGFFSWYLDSWTAEIKQTIMMILHELNQFNFKTIIKDEVNSRDIIKALYQEIIPQKIRHDLGEYYTPDWLIESVIDDIDYDGNLESRFLDPGCGSGGFLVEVINRVKQKNKGKPCEEILQKIINNVVGFDVNPVAVLTARTNYLLAISSLLEEKRTPIQITIPIYLADSIITPTDETKTKLSGDFYQISTVEGVFSLPKSFVDSGYLNDGMRIIEECLDAEYPTEDFIHLFKQGITLTIQDMNAIIEFYENIRRLHAENKNRIWVKIIQNSFAPLLHSEFDFVAGNPPWIKWEFLSKEYKQKLRYLYLEIYKLFSFIGMNAGLGYAHDDISAVFMYVAIDKYLKKGGIIGFVMKQTLYKSLAGREFRKFEIEKRNKSIPLKVLKVNDFLELKPFNASASAETSSIILKKGTKTEYPVPYLIWKYENGLPKESQRLEDLDGFLKIIEEKAQPFNPTDLKDVWVVTENGQFPLQFIKGKNHYKPRHGIVNDLNACFFVNLIEDKGNNVLVQNKIGRAKKKLKQITRTVEKDLIFPFLKPKNIKKWRIDGYNYAFLPQKKSGEDNASKLRKKYPNTYRYFFNFKSDLLKRSSRWFKIEGAPFYSVFGVGDYTFKPFKVAWCCMSYLPNFVVVSTVDDNVLGEKQVMPDNTIGYFSFDSQDEANFVCAVMNSSIVKKHFDKRSSKSKWGISISMAQSIPIPEFDEKNQLHKRLSKLSKKAHSTKNPEKIAEIELEINQIVSTMLIQSKMKSL